MISWLVGTVLLVSALGLVAWSAHQDAKRDRAEWLAWWAREAWMVLPPAEGEWRRHKRLWVSVPPEKGEIDHEFPPSLR